MTSERYEKILERVFEGQREFMKDNPFLQKKGYIIIKDNVTSFHSSLLEIANMEPVFDIYVIYIDVNGKEVRDFIRVK